MTFDLWSPVCRVGREAQNGPRCKDLSPNLLTTRGVSDRRSRRGRVVVCYLTKMQRRTSKDRRRGDYNLSEEINFCCLVCCFVWILLLYINILLVTVRSVLMTFGSCRFGVLPVLLSAVKSLHPDPSSWDWKKQWSSREVRFCLTKSDRTEPNVCPNRDMSRSVPRG